MSMASEMKVQLRQISASASEAAIGRHRVLIDRPAAKGGGDAGPMGGELFLAAVGGCFMSTLLDAIRAREAEISHMRVLDKELLERLVGTAERSRIMMNPIRGRLDVKVLIAAAV
jgi:uncharacterized OsmC-like protein